MTLVRHARSHRMWRWPAHPLSSRRHTLWPQAPSAGPRTAARAGGASTNDVYLTGVAHAITQWAEHAWPRAAGLAIPVMVPVNLRTPDEVAAPGNRLFLTRIDLPSSTMPVGRRLERTRAVTPALKSAEHRTVPRAAFTRLPRRLFERFVAASTAPGRLTVCASYLVVRRHLHYGEAAVHRIDPIICCPSGVPTAVVAISYGDTTSACFRIDQALPGADGLPAHWRQAPADLAATAPHGFRSRTRRAHTGRACHTCRACAGHMARSTLHSGRCSKKVTASSRHRDRQAAAAVEACSA